MRIIVQKFGGSSVANTERVKNVARRVVETSRQGWDVVVVVSAQGDTTDDLVKKAYAITEKPSSREFDMLLATGEQISIALLAMAIQSLGHPVVSLTGGQGGIITDAVHTKAKILDVDPSRIKKELHNGNIVIVAGFQGLTRDNEITTLGRGGSDTTAVALAVALDAEVCEIYTDVDGVYTADPRLVKDARKLSAISYGEMLEMATLGAVVLQPRAVEFAAQYGVVIHVRSSFNDHPGTIVKGAVALEKEMYVSGVTHDRNTAKIVLMEVPDQPGIAYQVFDALARERINVDMIVQSTKAEKVTDLLFSIPQDDLRLAREIIEGIVPRLGAKGYLWDDKVAKVSIVGAGMVSNPGVAAKMFKALSEQNINIQVISTSEIRISCLIEADRVEEAVKAIHSEFGLAETGETKEAVDLR